MKRPLASLAILIGAVASGPVCAQEAVEVRIGAVLASNSGQGFDPRLVALRRQFHTLFPYTSYNLVKEERRLVAPGVKVGFDIPGGRYLLVTSSGMKDERVSLHVMLIEGSRPVVDTALTLRKHATFLVGGPKHQEGVLIIAIGADPLPMSEPAPEPVSHQ
ncbi:MAG TPA: hypothetical protein VMW17_25080 [Candidatus Binatia bacterium]|nr:hypothetical protein [Candidatus Binatia bacterium]